jgi:flagellin
MSFSVNTNIGAQVALRTMNSVDKDLNATSKRIQTGKKVADAFDDAASYAVAQGLRSSIKGMEVVKSSLNGAAGLANTTAAAYDGLQKLVTTMRETVTKLADGSITADQKTTYKNDLAKMQTQFGELISNADYNGQNLLKTGGANISFIADENGSSSVSLTYTDVDALKTAFDTAVGTATGTDTTAAYQTLLSGGLKTLQDGLATGQAAISADKRSIDIRKDFMDTKIKATEQGLGALVDADLAEESAKLQSLQTRQQLAAQSLSIANQAPSIIMSLFR